MLPAHQPLKPSKTPSFQFLPHRYVGSLHSRHLTPMHTRMLIMYPSLPQAPLIHPLQHPAPKQAFQVPLTMPQIQQHRNRLWKIRMSSCKRPSVFSTTPRQHQISCPSNPSLLHSSNPQSTISPWSVGGSAAQRGAQRGLLVQAQALTLIPESPHSHAGSPTVAHSRSLPLLPELNSALRLLEPKRALPLIYSKICV